MGLPSSKLRALILCFVAIGAAWVSQTLAFGGDEAPADNFIFVESSDCPDASSLFEERGLPVPKTFGAPEGYGGGSCPDLEQLEANLDASTESTAGIVEMDEALKAGAIREDQDPRTYPEELQAAIGLDEKLTPEANAALDARYGKP